MEVFQILIYLKSSCEFVQSLDLTALSDYRATYHYFWEFEDLSTQSTIQPRKKVHLVQQICTS